MSRTFETTTKVWLTPWSVLSPEQLATTDDLTGLTLSNMDMGDQGWTLVGSAQVTVTVTTDTDKLVALKVDALRQEAKAIRAEAEVKAIRIEDQIKQLLALTYTPGEAA